MVTPTGIVPGSRIGGKYEVVEVLGYGGMGVVYKVREQVGAVSRIRALKTVLPRHASNPAIVARFREEAEKMCLLEHDNIVPVLSYSEEGEFPYLVMPFIEGQTLKEYLGAHMAKFGHPLPLVEVAEIGLQITRGLEVAHHFSNPATGKMQPIVHRDIKPGNIMVRTEGREGERRLRVLIMDFGIAKLVSDEDTGHTLTDVIGTVKYASPEQVQRSKDIDPRADIYSLGMVLYELACGRHVFSDISEHGVLMRMMQRELEEIVAQFPDTASPQFRELITKSIAVNRNDRWADVGAMRTLLREIHETERARRSDDSRQAEEVAMERRTAAVGTGASEFAASAFSQAEKLAEQAKSARDKSLHTEATQLFQAAATAFEQAAGFASQARDREQLVARIAALRPVREAAVAVGSEELAAEAHAVAAKATEAAERALAANDIATATREVETAERGWAQARQTAERESARREAEAACADLERAIGAEAEKLSSLPSGLRSSEATKRIAEARAQLEAARIAVRSEDPRRAAPALAAARAALDAASGARAAHLERAADEQADRLAARLRELEPAREISKLAPALATLEERAAAAERDRSEGRILEAVEGLETAREEADALAGEFDRTRAAEALFTRARESAERARAEAEPFAESAGGNEAFRFGREAVERAEGSAARDVATATREYESAARHFERARTLEEERLRKRLVELRNEADAAAGDLRALGDRFATSGEAKPLLAALDRLSRDGERGSLADAVRALEPLPASLRALVESARQALAAERARQEAESAEERASKADQRVRALGARADADGRVSRAREELKRGAELLGRDDWEAAKRAFRSAVERLESVAAEVETAIRAERIAALTDRLQTASEGLASITPTTRKLRKRHRDAASVAEKAGAALEAGDEAAASGAIVELENEVVELRAAAAAPVEERKSRAPLVVGGIGALAAAVLAIYLALPGSEPRSGREPVTSVDVPPVKPPPAVKPPLALASAYPESRELRIPLGGEQKFGASVTGGDESALVWRIDDRDAGHGSTFVLGREESAKAGGRRVALVAPVDGKPRTLATWRVDVEAPPPAPPPVLALAAAKPESRALRLPLGGEQKFSASVTGGDESALAWRVDDHEAGRGATFVLDAEKSAVPGARRVALVGTIDGKVETLATWQVEIEAPKLALASAKPESRSLKVPTGGEQKFSAAVTGGDAAALVWRVDDQEAGRGESFVFDRANSAKAGARRVALVTRIGGKSETLATWQVEVEAPELALTSAKPESRDVRVSVGGSQKFSASVTGGEESALVWRLDDREAGRGATFVLGGDDSAKPGEHRVALLTQIDGKAETLKSWQVQVEAPELAFADLEPDSARIERDSGAQIDFAAPVRPANVAGLSYEWRVNGERASGASGSRYRLRAASPGGYNVTVKASAPWGASIDKSWNVTVNPAPKPAPPPEVASARKDPESELRQWISSYCAAFEHKDTEKLRAIGHLKSSAEAERLGEALAVMQNLKVSCSNASIQADGNSATVSFDRTDHWTDPRGNPVERTLPRITKSLRRENAGWVVVR